MDSKSISIANSYRAMEDAHFNGGFFSAAVRAEAEAIKQMDFEAQLARYQNTFNQAWALAAEVTLHPNFHAKRQDENEQTEVDGSLDMSVVGMGEISIWAWASAADEDFQYPMYSLCVTVDSFDPVSRTYVDYENNQQLTAERHEPEWWHDPINATANGEMLYSDYHQMDQNMIRALEMLETLEAVHAKLYGKPNEDV